jgi:tetratricopeptide (TPR) repeat protein
MLSACSDGSIFKCAPLKDWGVETLGVVLPKPLPIDTPKLEVEAIATHYSGAIKMLAAVLREDFVDAQAYWNQAESQSNSSEQFHNIYEAIGVFHDRGLYVLSSAQSWVKTKPDSKAARLVLGMAYTKAALEGRGSKFFSDTSKEQFDLFKGRFSRARPLLEELMQSEDFYGLAAAAVIVHGYFLDGQSQKAWAIYEMLITKQPHFSLLYFDAASYAHPNWGADISDKRMSALITLAEKNNLDPMHKVVLTQVAQNYKNPIEQNPNPQAWRPYWMQRFTQAPSLINLRGWLDKETEVENWPIVAELTNKIIVLSPHHRYAWYLRGRALKEMGKTEDAYLATLSAAVLGHDWSMSQIIYAYIQGGLGRKPRDFEAMYEYCKLGAALGLPAAANCLASSYTEGFAGVKPNSKLAVAWSMLAARGGYANSQHDLAVMLPSVVTDGKSEEATQFWLRRAAENGHQYAINKLGNEAHPEQGFSCRMQDKVADAFDILRKIANLTK